MEALTGLGVLCFGVGCFFAVRVELDDDAHRRRRRTELLRSQGDDTAALEEALRPPHFGPVMAALCVVGGVAIGAGWAMAFG